MASAAVDADFIEERYFVALFDEALRLTRRDLTDEDISNAVEDVVGSFYGGPGNSCSVENFSTHGDLCAYFYRISPVSAGLARRKTLAAIRDCKEFRACLRRPSLKIISLGCGPGSDLVGLCSALCGKAEFEQLALILVDLNRGWEPFFRQVGRLLFDEHFGNASFLFQNYEVASLFICSDVADEKDVDYVEDLEEADIVWMKGFLSVLPSNTERYKAIELVVSSLRPGTLLVVIDSPTYGEYIHSSMLSDDLEQVYSTSEEVYKFLHNSRMCYGPGLSRSSNQEMFIFVKKETRRE